MLRRWIAFAALGFVASFLFIGLQLFENFGVSNAESIIAFSALTNQNSQYHKVEGDEQVSSTLAAPSKTSPEIILNESLVPAFTQIAQQFESTIQYPDFSLPIFDAASVEKYKPNTSAVMVYQKNGQVLSLETAALTYQPDEIIAGQVRLDNALGRTVHIQLMQDGQVIASQHLKMTDDVTHFAFEPLGQAWYINEIFLIASADIDGEIRTVSAPILRFDHTQASVELVGFENSFVQGPWLIIPARLRTVTPGYFRLEANLYSQNLSPLIHLTAEGLLDVGELSLNLKAHIQALKVMGDEGDYLLADFDLVQMPAPPDYETQQGRVPLKVLKVNGYSFSSYDNDSWEDSEADDRLVFLQQISQ